MARTVGESEVGVVLRSLAQLSESLRQTVVQALVEKQKGTARTRTLSAASGDAAAVLENIIREASALAVDGSADLARRADAIRSLQLAPFAVARPLLTRLLDPAQAPPVQIAALETTGQFTESAVADLLLGAWSRLGPGLRARAAETMLSRAIWLEKFLDAVEQGTVKTFEVDPARVQLLRHHSDPKTAARVARLFVDQRATRDAVVKRYQPALTRPGNEQRGKAVFREHCATCHRLDGVGNEVGAELKGIRQRGMASVLLNILDPNREVKPEYLAYAVVANDGRTLTGMIGAETANNITVRQIDGTSITVQRNQLKELRSLGMSFMPEGLEFNIDVAAMADLLAYLDSIN